MTRIEKVLSLSKEKLKSYIVEATCPCDFELDELPYEGCYEDECEKCWNIELDEPIDTGA